MQYKWRAYQREWIYHPFLLFISHVEIVTKSPTIFWSPCFPLENKSNCSSWRLWACMSSGGCQAPQAELPWMQALPCLSFHPFTAWARCWAAASKHPFISKLCIHHSLTYLPFPFPQPSPSASTPSIYQVSLCFNPGCLFYCDHLISQLDFNLTTHLCFKIQLIQLILTFSSKIEKR